MHVCEVVLAGYMSNLPDLVNDLDDFFFRFAAQNILANRPNGSDYYYYCCWMNDVCATRFSRPEGRILGPTNDHCRLEVGRLLVNWRCKRKVNSNKASARKKSAGPPTDRPTDRPTDWPDAA
ncbi:hypothetical protein T4D_14765 [Trichinella pseudospiralis]|uniref:Uncharacterized protein n=1 Tax=Trichinella pseudospiralis TaxID=6337 RepID=A0A0V1FLT1_TRIPS|nr:hypothetical protein T4D_14765 [Trichinella pseudospiralis]